FARRHALEHLADDVVHARLHGGRPAHDDADLSAELLVRRAPGQLGERAAQHLLVGLGELARDGGRAVGAQRVRHRLERGRDAVRCLEEHHGARLGGHGGQRPCAVAGLAGQEALESEPVGRQAGEGERREDGTGPRRGGDPQPALDRTLDDAVAGVGDRRHARVRDDHHRAAARHDVEQLVGTGRLVVLVVARDAAAHLDAEPGGERVQAPGVLRRDDVGTGQQADQAGRGVLGVADRGGGQDEGSGFGRWPGGRGRVGHEAQGPTLYAGPVSQQPDATGAPPPGGQPEEQQGVPGTYGAHLRRAAVSTGPFPAVGLPEAPPEPPVRDRLLRDLLGERRLALGRTVSDRVWALLGALLVTAVAAGARLWELARPGSLVFDETYYVKEGWSLASLGWEAAWPEEPNPAFEAGDVSSYDTAEAEYVVHPPVGKRMIALGMRLLGGAQDPAAWRIASAVIGILAVFLLVRIARRLFASTALGLVAGLLLAVDGEAIVHSRTGLLDQFLMFWVLVGFGCLVLDREGARRR